MKQAKPARPNLKNATQRVRPILARLKRRYPEARCALDHQNPLELLVATILSAQCTDTRVNLVTRDLFAKYRTSQDYANANPDVFEQQIKSTGFFRNKTKSILAMAKALVERHGGRVPNTMEALTALPGVGRKTANVVLGTAFGINEGVVVDTHVSRIANRLKLTNQKDPAKIELDLMRLVPR
ncbi:MAG: endonuclease III, partial [Gemmatimonadetes bacterium]|nr:endonuclease III [Gemmatimonadota bacterium]